MIDFIKGSEQMKLAQIYYNFSEYFVTGMGYFSKDFEERLKACIKKMKIKNQKSKIFSQSTTPATYLSNIMKDRNTSEIVKYLFVMGEATQDQLAKILNMKYNTLRIHLEKLEPIIEYNKESYPIKLKLAIEIIPSYVLEKEKLDHWDTYKEEYKRDYFEEKERQDFVIDEMKRKIANAGKEPLRI